MFLEPGYQKRESGLWVPDQAGFVPIPGIGPALPFANKGPTIAQTDAATSAASGPYTFTSANLGAAAPGRVILVGVIAIGPSLAVRTLSSVTVAGNAATLVAPGAAQGLIAAWAYIADSVNATGNIVVTFNSTTASCGVVVLALNGGAILQDTDNQYLVPTATTLAANLDELAGGVSVFVAGGVAAGAITVAWSAATLGQSFNPNTNTPAATAVYRAPVTAVNRAETATWSATATNRGIAAMHWR